MQSSTHAGALLIVGSLVLLAMTGVHPAHVPLGDADGIARLAWVDGFAHSLAILGAGLLLAGQVGLSRWLGLERSVVAVALVAAALPATAIVVAAACDGFVIPQLADEWMRADAGGRATLEALMRFCVLLASALTRIYMLLIALAVLLWSWAIRRERLDPGLPWLGLLVGIAGVASLAGGPAYVSVHELLLLVLGQSAWMVWAGVRMMRTRATAAGPRDAAA
jgi:hypothetical protein